MMDTHSHSLTQNELKTKHFNSLFEPLAGAEGREGPRGEADERVDPAGKVPRHQGPAARGEGEEAVSSLARSF